VLHGLNRNGNWNPLDFGKTIELVYFNLKSILSSPYHQVREDDDMDFLVKFFKKNKVQYLDPLIIESRKYTGKIVKK